MKSLKTILRLALLAVGLSSGELLAFTLTLSESAGDGPIVYQVRSREGPSGAITRRIPITLPALSSVTMNLPDGRWVVQCARPGAGQPSYWYQYNNALDSTFSSTDHVFVECDGWPPGHIDGGHTLVSVLKVSHPLVVPALLGAVAVGFFMGWLMLKPLDV